MNGTFIEVFNKGKIVNIDNEKDFVEAVYKKYSIKIITVEYGFVNDKNTTHANIRIYADLSDDSSEFVKTLRDGIRKYEVVGYAINMSEMYDDVIVAFAEDVINIFMDTFGYDRNECVTASLYAHDFYRSVLMRLYGVSIDRIRRKIYTVFGVTHERLKVFTFYQTDISIVIVADDDNVYNKLIGNRNRIEKICRKIMMKYDKFNVLDNSPINYNIRLGSTLTKQERNMYGREILASKWQQNDDKAIMELFLQSRDGSSIDKA